MRAFLWGSGGAFDLFAQGYRVRRIRSVHEIRRRAQEVSSREPLHFDGPSDASRRALEDVLKLIAARSIDRKTLDDEIADIKKFDADKRRRAEALASAIEKLRSVHAGDLAAIESILEEIRRSIEQSSDSEDSPQIEGMLAALRSLEKGDN
jgi:hypothetical protein